MPMTPARRDARPPAPVLARILQSPQAKFTGEPPYVEELWQLATAGLADVDLYCGGTLVSAFELWGALSPYAARVGAPVLLLWEDADGFVFSRAVSLAEYEAFKLAGEGETAEVEG